MKRLRISQNEENVIKFLDENELDIFTFSSLSHELKGKVSYLQSTIESLVDRGLLSRIEKGKYCRHTFRNEFVISNYLVEDGVVAYWSALNIHGLTEQISNTVFVQTTKQKLHKTVFGVRYQFIKVKPQKMMGIELQGYGNHQYRITNVEKTIVDCFDLPEYSGGFAELLRAFAQAEVKEDQLIAYCEAIDNISVIKRMAYLAEILQKPNLASFLGYAQTKVNQKFTLFDTLGREEGEFVNRWRLRMNVSKEDILYLTNKQY